MKRSAIRQAAPRSGRPISRQAADRRQKRRSTSCRSAVCHLWRSGRLCGSWPGSARLWGLWRPCPGRPPAARLLRIRRTSGAQARSSLDRRRRPRGRRRHRRGAPPMTARLELVRFADVEREQTDWLWPAYIPAGTYVVLDGDPGLGKSTFAVDLAARVSTGRPMLDGSGGGTPRGVDLLLRRGRSLPNDPTQAGGSRRRPDAGVCGRRHGARRHRLPAR